jgi:hypothetical protein
MLLTALSMEERTADSTAVLTALVIKASMSLFRCSCCTAEAAVSVS